MRVPGIATSGQASDRIVSSVDIYPTLMELCGVGMSFETDGHSMTNLLDDPHSANWSEASWAYFNQGITLRTPGYRLTKYFRKQQPVIELFDHHADPWENRNIADQDPEVVKKLLPVLEEKDFGMYRAVD